MPHGNGWRMTVTPVGVVATLLGRLLDQAAGGSVAFGVDFPIGLPRGYVVRHATAYPDFPAFLRSLAGKPNFFEVAETLDQIGPDRPFYPMRSRKGMTRLSHAIALGLDDANALSRRCDRATPSRPAGAPLFWTLGANQSGKAAISAWRDMLLPALAAGPPIALWPFDGPFRSLLQPGVVTIAETYPADALRQLGLRPIGSKRRQCDRMALTPGLRNAMDRLGVVPDQALAAWLDRGFGAEAAGEDRLDCVLGLLCVLSVISGSRPDEPPADPWLSRWEGWVLGQDSRDQEA